MLQVSIFQTLQNNLDRVNFSSLLVSVMTIADEVDAQLAQQMSSYIVESEVDSLPKGDHPSGNVVPWLTPSQVTGIDLNAEAVPRQSAPTDA